MPEPVPREGYGGDAVLLSVDDFRRKLGLSRSRFYGLQKNGRFPAPAGKLGKSPRWRKGEIDDWINADMPPLLEWKWKPNTKA